MQNHDRLEYQYKSIEDCQSTVRALDVKAGFLIAIVAQPIFHLDAVYQVYTATFSHSSHWILLLLPNFLLWLLSTYTLTMSVVAISNPTTHVLGANVKDTFYYGELFKFCFIDSIVNRNKYHKIALENTNNVADMNFQDATTTLHFERLKLTYIRDIKAKRLSICIGSMKIWIPLSIIIYLCKIFITQK